ncbi:MAG TPA: hypothetical protein VJ161_12100 [Geobacteraceae bacterium]|nr:hypothetical protein [Geobacteraceae bacterium]
MIKKKFNNVAVFIEFVASSGLAVFFHWVLHYEEVGFIIFGIGILLSLATYLLREEMEKTREELIRQYHNAHEITYALACVSDPECLAKAHELMTGAKRTIQVLQQGYVPLEETEFYLEAAKGVENASGQIKCVDPISSGWERASLFNFYQSNLHAMERGIQITRIFVINRDALTKPYIRDIILPQVRDGIICRIAYRNELPLASDVSLRDTNGSFDFAIYDDRVVTEVFGQSGKYFGRKTTQPAEVAKFLHFYDLIAHSSHVVSMQDEKMVVAGEVLEGSRFSD